KEYLLNDADGDRIYTSTYDVGSVTNIIYKFVMIGSAGDRWEDSISNRTRDGLTGIPVTLPVVYFENDSIFVDMNDNGIIVYKYELSQNYPNPFNPSTSIMYSVKESGIVSLKLYNSIGQEVATLVNGQMEAGNHTVQFNASTLSSGVYFYKIESGKFSSIKKMILLK
ncbi:MAG: T9SS type A sorting domain-containing protein, partial [Bacteroidetes bacterium]|nr:T9SS type A sorting domain-containing protein [Bacteroidota bacterium]